MANIKYATFSNFTDTLGGLVNISWTAMPSTQQVGIRQYFNNNAYNGWIRGNWLAESPNGEARFVGNVGQYPNDLSQAAYWTSTAVTPTGQVIANPADGKVSATKILETSATSAHKTLQSFTFIPNATYQVTCYFRPIGGRYLYLTAFDGVTTYSSFFNGVTGVVGTNANCSSPPTINQCSNGFWVCSIFFTSNAAAGTGTYGPAISTDGSTTSYAGDATKGIYTWGNTLSQTTYAAPTALLIPNDQLGEDFIDAVFQVWQQNPVGAGYPTPIAYEMLPDGVQVIGANSWVWNGWLYSFPTWYTAGYPVFLYYRKGMPNFTGLDYSGASTYAVNDQILFTDSTGVMNFWKCIVATSAGQSPDTTPASWSILQLPQFLFQYVVFASLADYLRMDAQFEKADTAQAKAEEYLMLEFDRQERQMDVELPFRMQTHITTQQRRFY